MIEVKPKFIIMPLDEEKGIDLKVHRDGNKGILGFELLYAGEVMEVKGKLKDFSKPSRVFLNDMAPLIKAINADPGAFVNLFEAIKKLQTSTKKSSKTP